MSTVGFCHNKDKKNQYQSAAGLLYLMKLDKTDKTYNRRNFVFFKRYTQ